MTEANRQTIATRKYQQKAGLIAKSYKIKRDIAERFGKACEAAGVSQAAKISELMESFIKEQSGGGHE
jgi:hypothetical protein